MNQAKNLELNTRVCPLCAKPLPKNRGVCPECGGMTNWFKMRLVFGCVSVLFFVLAMLGMLAVGVWLR